MHVAVMQINASQLNNSLSMSCMAAFTYAAQCFLYGLTRLQDAFGRIDFSEKSKAKKQRWKIYCGVRRVSAPSIRKMHFRSFLVH